MKRTTIKISNLYKRDSTHLGEGQSKGKDSRQGVETEEDWGVKKREEEM